MSEHSPEQPLPDQPDLPGQNQPSASPGQTSEPATPQSPPAGAGPGENPPGPGEPSAQGQGASASEEDDAEGPAHPDQYSEEGYEETAGSAGPMRGRRVTHRTVRRRESEETTQETITEDLPVYQGPSSTHPAPVG